MESLRLRSILATLGVTLAIVWVLPNILNVENNWWPSKSKLNYGLDIQGGLHLVMGADVEGVLTESTTRLIASLGTEFAKDNINISDIKVTNPSTGEITLLAADEAAKQKAKEYLSKQ